MEDISGELFNAVQLITMYMYRNLLKNLSYIKFFMTLASVSNSVVNLKMNFKSVNILYYTTKF